LPRSTERIHFRGQAAIEAVQDLRETYPAPEDFVDVLAYGSKRDPLSYPEVAKRVQKHQLFGPWVSFKAADLLERVLRARINFDESEVFMFKEPMAGAQLVWQELNPSLATRYSEKEIAHEVVERMRVGLKKLKAPPHYDRPIGLQEIETCLCKYKSYTKGHYWVGKDIKEIRHGLRPWLSYSTTAIAFVEWLPKEVKGATLW
jgi:hypothetical protein